MKLPYTKKAVKSKEKLKKLHWQALKNTEIEGSIWWDLSDQKVAFDEFDFESQFSEKAPSAPKKKEGGAKKKEVQESLIDPMRGQNISIVLSRLRMSNAEIVLAVMNLDATVLDDEKLQALSKIAPEPDELDAVKDFPGAKESLGAPEQFFLAVKDIPRMKGRLELFLFSKQFNIVIGDLDAKIGMMEVAQSKLSNSPSLKTLLELVLAMGNYLNSQGNAGGVYGYKLATLGKLKQTKAQDGKMTLIHFVAVTVERKYKDCLGVENEFATLKDASINETSVVAADVNRVLGTLKKLETEIQAPNKPPGDKFQQVMEAFLAPSRSKAEKCKARLDTVLADAKVLAAKYGEKPSDPPEALWGQFSTFITDFAQARKDLEKWREEEAEAAKPKMEIKKSPKKEESGAGAEGQPSVDRRLSSSDPKRASQKQLGMPNLSVTVPSSGDISGVQLKSTKNAPTRPEREATVSNELNSAKDADEMAIMLKKRRNAAAADKKVRGGSDADKKGKGLASKWKVQREKK